MERNGTDELQRSIDALLRRIEAQKRVLDRLLRDRGPRVVLGSWRAVAAAPKPAADSSIAPARPRAPAEG